MRFICITREHFWKVVWVHTKSKWSSVYHYTSFGCSILSLHLKNHHDSHFPSANVGDVEVGIYLESGGNMISAELWVKPKNHLRIDESTLLLCARSKVTRFTLRLGRENLSNPSALRWQRCCGKFGEYSTPFFHMPSVWLAERWEKFWVAVERPFFWWELFSYAYAMKCPISC